MRLFDMDSREDYLLDGKYKVATPYAPCVDVVEVVRCRDCIRTKERDEYTGRLWCSIHRGYMEDTYYCADGLRREDGEA